MQQNLASVALSLEEQILLESDLHRLDSFGRYSCSHDVLEGGIEETEDVRSAAGDV